jgi:ketosteroid isomerase-like protein
MKTRALASALAIPLLFSIRTDARSGEGATHEVEALERELVAAIGRGDLSTYDRIVADDYVAFEASGKTTPKAEILASYRSGARHYTNLEIFDVQERIFGDTAVVSARTKGLRKEGDRDVPNRVRYIRVYAKRAGRWRAVAQMAAVLTENPGVDPRPLTAGSWGGDHVGMEVTEKGARLDYDCAHGTIDEVIALDERGRFEVRGTHVREGPGPSRPEGGKGEPARYSGTVDGDTMTLTVTLAASEQQVGSFTLIRGRMPRIQKCG